MNNSIVEARRALKDAQAQVVAYEPTLATARQAHDRAVKDLKAKQDEEQQKLEAVRAQVSEFRARLGAVS